MSNRPQRRQTSHTARVERKLLKEKRLDKFVHYLLGRISKPWRQSRRPYLRLVKRISVQGKMLQNMCAGDLDARIEQLKHDLVCEGMTDELLVKSFALIREAARRSVGMAHFDTQLLGGLIMFEGGVAEMQTGEGKTLTATLPAAAAALTGVPVHVITVNEYLAKRDMRLMEPVYQRLQLSVGVISSDMSTQEKREAYLCDIVYCTNKDLVFDYLKDCLILDKLSSPLAVSSALLKGHIAEAEQLMLRGLHYAVVDEVDSVLMDEARTPLILSGQDQSNGEQALIYHQVMNIAQLLQNERDYLIDRRQRRVKLLAQGEQKLQQQLVSQNIFWRGRVRRQELIEKALTALILYERDKQYVVIDGKVQIVDEHTGRIMADRTWEQGLHQLIEVKENCTLTQARSTLIKMSYQRFFRMFRHLGGMTGTAKEVTDELWNIYHLSVVAVPPHKPSKRLTYPKQCFFTQSQKYAAVVERALTIASLERAVLIGTSSVAASERLATIFRHASVNIQVLNAKNNREEAEIIAAAGEPGRITLATNMAGRGTDIKLHPQVSCRGGLHVILTELHDASRIDRQLQGRCARQGDPGSFELMLSLEDELIARKRLWRESGLVKRALSRGVLPSRLVLWWAIKTLYRQQAKLERQHTRMRIDLLHIDEIERERLAFAGRLT